MTIQRILGHRYLATTSRYARVTRQRIQELPSPLDRMSMDPPAPRDSAPDWTSE